MNALLFAILAYSASAAQGAGPAPAVTIHNIYEKGEICYYAINEADGVVTTTLYFEGKMYDRRVLTGYRNTSDLRKDILTEFSSLDPKNRVGQFHNTKVETRTISIVFTLGEIKQTISITGYETDLWNIFNSMPAFKKLFAELSKGQPFLFRLIRTEEDFQGGSTATLK